MRDIDKTMHYCIIFHYPTSIVWKCRLYHTTGHRCDARGPYCDLFSLGSNLYSLHNRQRELYYPTIYDAHRTTFPNGPDDRIPHKALMQRERTQTRRTLEDRQYLWGHTIALKGATDMTNDRGKWKSFIRTHHHLTTRVRDWRWWLKGVIMGRHKKSMWVDNIVSYRFHIFYMALLLRSPITVGWPFTTCEFCWWKCLPFTNGILLS